MHDLAPVARQHYTEEASELVKHEHADEPVPIQGSLFWILHAGWSAAAQDNNRRRALRRIDVADYYGTNMYWLHTLKYEGIHTHTHLHLE